MINQMVDYPRTLRHGSSYRCDHVEPRLAPANLSRGFQPRFSDTHECLRYDVERA